MSSKIAHYYCRFWGQFVVSNEITFKYEIEYSKLVQ